MKKGIMLVLPAMLPFILAGCVSVKTLNDPARSLKGPDVASLKPDSDGRLYEMREANGVQVSYNLVSIGNELVLRLILRNKTDTRLKVVPRISMMDANGLRIRMDGYESKLSMLSAQLGASGPGYAAAPTGGTGFAAGYARGQAMGNNMLAAYAQGVQAKAAEDLRWMMAHWLNESYDLRPGEAASGAVTFQSSGNLSLPLKVIIHVAGAEHEFITKSK